MKLKPHKDIPQDSKGES